ncbi:MAG: trypsin-like peptidase domain-containing protein [Verrucomicrobia bacterium]|nr:trypsin-like peptidase domain-containing protein [Verrucomicrobiota bacterium]
MRALPVLALLAGMVGAGYALTQRSEGFANLFQRPMDVVGVARKLRPAVVLVENFDSKGDVQGTGTGFFVSAEGHLVTNAHVVEGGAKFRIKREDGSAMNVAGVLVYDRATDLAVLKVEGQRLPILALGRLERPEAGEKVVVVGSPLGLEGTVTDGIVSANRTVQTDEVIQITAPLSPGSSGSPVADLKGRVIGVATLASFGKAQALNFAVPVSRVRAAVQSALERKEFVVLKSSPASRTGDSVPGPSGLSSKDIVIRFKAGYSSADVLAEVKEKGLVGSFSEEQLRQIRELGGRDDLLALCKAQPGREGLLKGGASESTEAERNRVASGLSAEETQERLRWSAERIEIERTVTLQLDRAHSAALAREQGKRRSGDSLARASARAAAVRSIINAIDQTYSDGARYDAVATRRRLLSDLRAAYQAFRSECAALGAQ